MCCPLITILLKYFYSHRLEHIDEVLRSARQSGYLYIRTVLTVSPTLVYNALVYASLFYLPDKFSTNLLLNLEMGRTTRRTSTHR